MGIDEIERRLAAWKKRHIELEAAYNDLYQLTGAMPDCKLLEPVYDVWMAYTVAVSEIVGDKAEWLQWYQYECYMGQQPKKTVLRNGKEIEVKTLRQLARVILD